MAAPAHDAAATRNPAPSLPAACRLPGGLIQASGLSPDRGDKLASQCRGDLHRLLRRCRDGRLLRRLMRLNAQPRDRPFGFDRMPSLEDGRMADSGRAEVMAPFLSELIAPAFPWIPQVQDWTEFQVFIPRKRQAN